MSIELDELDFNAFTIPNVSVKANCNIEKEEHLTHSIDDNTKALRSAKKTNCSTDMDISSSFHKSFLSLRVSHACHMQQLAGVSLVLACTNYMVLLRKGPLLDKTFEFVFMLAFKIPSNKVPNWTQEPPDFYFVFVLEFLRITPGHHT